MTNNISKPSPGAIRTAEYLSRQLPYRLTQAQLIDMAKVIDREMAQTNQHCQNCGGKGWFFELACNGLSFEKCDSCRKFDSPKEAAEHVEKCHEDHRRLMAAFKEWLSARELPRPDSLMPDSDLQTFGEALWAAISRLERRAE